MEQDSFVIHNSEFEHSYDGTSIQWVLTDLNGFPYVIKFRMNFADHNNLECEHN